MCVDADVCTHMCVYADVCTHMCVYADALTCVHASVHMRTHIYTHTHTHTPTCAKTTALWVIPPHSEKAELPHTNTAYTHTMFASHIYVATHTHAHTCSPHTHTHLLTTFAGAFDGVLEFLRLVYRNKPFEVILTTAVVVHSAAG